jgi:hypothetical protein
MSGPEQQRLATIQRRALVRSGLLTSLIVKARHAAGGEAAPRGAHLSETTVRAVVSDVSFA